MPVSVVIGGQYGSEGKGKASHFFAKERNASAVVRVGGSNSGHTVIDEFGKEWVFRHLPTAAILDNVKCVIPAGAYINPNVLLDEISSVSLAEERLIIDPNAVLITQIEINEEKSKSLQEDIGSTQSGTGAAVIKRIQRNGNAKLISEDKRFQQYIGNTKSYMRSILKEDKRIIIEGTQGYGLSVLHSEDYPFTTSRDTTASAFASEAGLSPIDVDDVIMVIRSFPIRVGGNSGPLKNETTWDAVQHISGRKDRIREYTTVTNRLRRVAYFDHELVNKTIEVNSPTTIVMNHIDYIDAKCDQEKKITSKAMKFIDSVESAINRKINYVGFSPRCTIKNTISNRKDKRVRNREAQKVNFQLSRA